MSRVVAWRGINELGEVVTDWIEGLPPKSFVDLHGNPDSYGSIEFAYSNDVSAEFVADIRQASAALNQAATFPADIALARQAIHRALARIGDPVPVTMDFQKVADENLRDALRWRFFRKRATPGEVRAIVSGPWEPDHRFHAMNDVAVDEALARGPK